MPLAEPLEVLTVIVEVPLVEMLEGLNEAESPEGRPVTLKATEPLNPPLPATVTV